MIDPLPTLALVIFATGVGLTFLGAGMVAGGDGRASRVGGFMLFATGLVMIVMMMEAML